jgi:murein DD-endopeptidase MepM/ murein hydrolase activator NlpD
MRWTFALTSTSLPLQGLCSAGLTVILALSGCAAPAPVTQTPLRLPQVNVTHSPAGTPVPTLVRSPVSERPTATVTVSPSAASAAETPCPESGTACILTGHFVFQRPVAPAKTVIIDPTYRYGATQEDKRAPHHGVDFPNTAGTSVLAVGDGEVVVAGNDKLALYGWVTNFYGNLVVLEHHLPGFEQTIYTLYGHLSKLNVQVGQSVQTGDKIGEVGSTGIAIGSHLHLEMRITNNDYKSTRNPELWLVPLPGTGTLAGRIVDANGQLVRTTIIIQRLVNDEIFPVYPIEAYARESLNSDDVLQENFAVSDRPAGSYRLSLIYNGRFYEQQVQVEPGKLTLVIFHVN